jgi:hypothetical protein
MTKLLEQAVDTVRTLPPKMQDDLARLLLQLAGHEQPKALAELDEILGYIIERSPQGARHVHERIQAMTALLLKYPQAGQLTSHPRLRRITTPPYPFAIF